ncbi:MAG: hypothetical protein ABR581_05770 [Thermoleophilaceae bacterium]
MTYLSDPHHFRKMVAGLCMVAAPLLLLVSEVLHPAEKTDTRDQLAVITGHLDRWYAAHLIAIVAIALLVPAVLGLMHMLREREVALGHLGGGLAMLGLLAITGIVAIEGFVGWQAAAGGDRAQMVALFERLTGTAGFVVPFLVVAFGFMLGLTCLAVGLYRARVVPPWVALFLILSAVGFVVEFAAALNAFGIVGAAFLLVGLGSVGRMVLAESDEDWEHTPEHRGFRPLLGMR